MSATRTLEFAVKGQQITCDYAIPEAVNESREYLHAHFTVDEAWSGLTIFALFYNRVCAAEPIELDETMTCAVPAVVLEKPVSEFLVGLVGYGANGYRLTTDRAGIDLGQAAYTSGATMKPPTPDVYAQLLEQVVRKLDANQGAEHAGKALIVDANGNVAPGESGDADAVKYTPEERTEAEQMQARANLGLYRKYEGNPVAWSGKIGIDNEPAKITLETSAYGGNIIAKIKWSEPDSSGELSYTLELQDVYDYGADASIYWYGNVGLADTTAIGFDPGTESKYPDCPIVLWSRSSDTHGFTIARADFIAQADGKIETLDVILYDAEQTTIVYETIPPEYLPPPPVTSVNGKTGDVKLGLTVTVTEAEDGTMTASHSASEIIAHVEAGGSAIAEYNGYTMQYYGAEDGMAVFALDGIGNSQVRREMLVVLEDSAAFHAKTIYTPPSSTKIITITANDDGTYATDTPYADIVAAIEAGKNIIARREIVSGSGSGVTTREYQLAYDYAEDTASTQAISFVYNFPASASELRAEVISIYDMTHDTVPSAEVAVKSYKYSHAEMTGATEAEAGAAGLVPAPAAGYGDRALMATGEFAPVVPAPATAAVGDILRVAAIDEAGVPTAWEASDEVEKLSKAIADHKTEVETALGSYIDDVAAIVGGDA